MNAKDKVKKVQPIVRAREIQVNQEFLRLKEIREMKVSIVTELKKHQQSYIEGVELLNKERTSMDRLKVSSLESSVDHAKNSWYKCLQKAQEIESREKVQLSELIKAEKNLKSVEKLMTKHHEQIQAEEVKKDQKLMDEISIRRSNSQN